MPLTTSLENLTLKIAVKLMKTHLQTTVNNMFIRDIEDNDLSYNITQSQTI